MVHEQFAPHNPEPADVRFWVIRRSVRFMRLAQLGRGVFIICPQGFGNLSACYFVSSEKSVRLSVKP